MSVLVESSAKHYCITGAGAELAEPLVLRLLQAGHKVTAVCRYSVPNVYREQERCEILHGVDLSAKNLSLSNAGPFDGLVTMTGSFENGMIWNGLNATKWEVVLTDTLTSVFNAFRCVRIVDGGNVVVVGSVVGSTGGYGCANYAAAKAGLVGLVRAAANEWAARGVCVNLLELGYVDAGMGKQLTEEVRQKVLKTIPLRRFAEPAEVSQAIRFLLDTRYMTGGVLTLAGGLR